VEEFEAVDKFEAKKQYFVMEDYDYTPPSGWRRLKGICYKLTRGQPLRFRGPNLGNAEFWAEDGRVVILPPKVAFRIVGLKVNRG